MRDRVPSLLRTLAFVGLTALAGCSNQGEGERCTEFTGSGDAAINGTSECQSGLECVQPRQVGPPPAIPPLVASGDGGLGAGTLGVCCPPEGQPVTAFVCQTSSGGSLNPGGRDAMIPFDAGPDAPADAPSDAPADARHDGALHDASPDSGHDGGHPDASKDSTVTDAMKDGGVHDAPKDAPPG